MEDTDSRDRVPPERYETAFVQRAFEAIWHRSRRVLVVYFRKRTDGTRRRMVFFYDREKADAAPLTYDHVRHSTLPVWDVEKGAPRTISLDRVEKIVDGGRVVFPTSDLPTTLQEANREMERLFGKNSTPSSTAQT